MSVKECLSKISNFYKSLLASFNLGNVVYFIDFLKIDLE